MASVLPLDGLLVVAVEQAVAAPFCTSRLADAGARVIKIERPEGDFARYYDRAANGTSSYFAWLNRGKELVVLDLSREADRRLLHAMIAKADVLVQNLKVGALARMGFPVRELRRDYPSLICCSISGYGDSGPMADRKAYDLLVQADVGLASVTGGPDGPSRVGISIVDIATGATAHASILETLIARSRTGEGAEISISMFDVMADWMTVPLLNAEAGNPPRRLGLAHPSIAPYGMFMTQDGKALLISIQSEREWRRLCVEVLGDASLPDDPRFSTMVARVANRALTDARVAEAFASQTRSSLIERLTQADIAFAEVNDLAGLAAHPHLRRVAVELGNARIAYPAPGALFDGESRWGKAVPDLGAHTQSVRAEFEP